MLAGIELIHMIRKGLAAGVDRIDGRLVGPRSCPSRPCSDRRSLSCSLSKKRFAGGRLTLDSQQEVDSLALLVDSAVEVSQTPLTLKYVSSMRQLTDRALVFPGHPLDE